MHKLYDDNSQTIGQTPLVRLNRITRHNIMAKVEGRNPSFSVKCRIGSSMVWAAEKAGLLKPGMTIVEATSGNTGIALAFVGAARGYSVTLTMPNTMSVERRKVLKALGANLVLTEGAKGMKGAIAAAEEIVASDPARHFMPRQFDNPANPDIHEQTTGPEIWEATGGGIDILVCGVGTGGTLTGVSRYIKETQGKAITVVAVEPESSDMIRAALAGRDASHAPHKIQGIGAGFIPNTLDLRQVDRAEAVSDAEAMQWAHRLMREEGILVGISCGAAMAVAERVASEPANQGKQVVVVLPDAGERYLSSPLFEGMFDES